ncbi:purine-cytosine permease family protein [Mariniluteicoccus flavus]
MSTSAAPPAPAPRALAVETHGIDVIDESERRGRPRSLFWPWAAGQLSVFNVAWGGYLFDFGLSLWQAVLVVLVGSVGSFLLVGLVSLVGQRGSAPTMVLSRAAFGVRGNVLPGLVSYLLLIGWEIVLCSLAVMTTDSVAARMGWTLGPATKGVVLAAVIAIVMALGILGFEAVMRAQRWLTVAILVATIGFVVLTLDDVNWANVLAHPAGSAPAVIGATTMVLAGFGLGWTSAAADYSRYLPRSVRPGGVVGWTTLGGSLPLVILLGHGLLLCGSSPELSAAVVKDPLGALLGLLPGWFVIPFWLVTIAALIAGAVLDIYSSGLALVAMGLPVKRWQAVGLDGLLATLGTLYVVWFAPDFLTPFQAFLITLGVPLAAWTGVFGADVILRWRAGYDEAKLFDATASGYGSVRWSAIAIMVLGCAIGFGLVTNTGTGWLSWQGYLLGPLGLGGREGQWAYASLGLPVTLVLTLLAGLGVRRFRPVR